MWSNNIIINVIVKSIIKFCLMHYHSNCSSMAIIIIILLWQSVEIL